MTDDLPMPRAQLEALAHYYDLHDADGNLITNESHAKAAIFDPERPLGQRQIEIAAIAMWHAEVERYCDNDIALWADVDDFIQDDWRLWARAALQSLIPGEYT